MTDVNSPLINPAGRPHLRCPGCKTFVVWPTSLASSDATTFCKIAHRDRLEAANFAETVLGLEPRAAKALALHVSDGDACHKCGLALPKGTSLCLCKSVNVNW